MKDIGKPYPGEPDVRFDEGAMEKCRIMGASTGLQAAFSGR